MTEEQFSSVEGDLNIHVYSIIFHIAENDIGNISSIIFFLLVIGHQHVGIGVTIQHTRSSSLCQCHISQIVLQYKEFS